VRITMSMYRCLALAAVLPLFFACVQGPVRNAPGTDPNLLTSEQLREVDARNLYDVIERLRPRWLTVRGGPRSFGLETEIVVFQNEMYLGDVSTLRNLGADGVYTIRWLDGPTASATLPGMSSRHVSGAIVISMQPPNR
jgi:hypothetical protein